MNADRPIDYTDEEIEQINRQEPLPCNQGANLPAEEQQPTKQLVTYIHTQ